MGHAVNSIIARIEWCRRKRTQARGQREFEEWHAEEDGLRDALLNRDHSNQYRYGARGTFVRYVMGLEEGRDLIRVDAVGRQFRNQGSE